MYVNRDVVSEAVFNSYADLIKPEMQGKWCLLDPREFGAGEGWVTGVMLSLGKEFVRTLFSEGDPLLGVDSNSMAREVMIRKV